MAAKNYYRNDNKKVNSERMISLTTNMFQVDTSAFQKQSWYRYEVVITNKYCEFEEMFDTRRELIAKLATEFKTPFSFDGDKILYVQRLLEVLPGYEVPQDFYFTHFKDRRSRRSDTQENQALFLALENDPETLNFLVHSEERKAFNVSLRRVTWSDESRTQLLQMALSFSSYLSGNFVRGAASFNLANQRPLGSNWTKILFTGFHESFRQVQLGTVLNVDMCYHVSNWFGNLIDYLTASFETGNLKWMSSIATNKQMQKFANDEIRGLSVISNITKRKYRLEGIDFTKTASSHFFEHEGKQVSIAEYTNTKYQTTLKYPNLGLAYVTKGDSTIHLPLESLVIVQSRFNGELNSADRKAMIDQSRTTPQGKLEFVRKNIKEIIDNSYFKAFDVGVSPTPIEVSAVVLNPQPLLCNGKVDIPDEDRGWQLSQFHSVVAPKGVSWGLVWPAGANKNRIIDFANNLVETGEELGFVFAKVPNQRQTRYNDGQGYIDCLKDLWKLPPGQKPLFTLILFPEEEFERYKAIKNFTDVEVGMVTKCYVVDSPKKWNDHTTIRNLLASINNRVNGKNWIINPAHIKNCLGFQPDVKGDSLCVMGLDVCHGTESIVALCSSRDQAFSKYHVSMGKQESQTEIVGSELMEKMMTEVLTKWRKFNNCLPSRILFYRDGVGEGQYQLVENSELDAIKKVIKQMYTMAKQPFLTYVIVQKRNHLRCFNKDGKGNFSNPPVGTLVHEKVVDLDLPNFYLYSHKAVTGTARPTHYQVLTNGMKLNIKNLAEFTFALAHLHQGCTKAISVPAPAVLAHKAAYRANSYFGKSTLPHPNLADCGFML